MTWRQKLEPYGFSPRMAYDRFLVKHGLAKPLLYSLVIEPTNRCNLNCPICFRQADSSYKRGNMDFGLFQRIIDYAREIRSIKQVGMFYGGEPLLHPHFVDMLRYATNPQWALTFFSNGMRFNEDISQAVVDLEVDAITFSLDGIGAVHEEHRRGSNYDTVKRNILRLLEVRGDKQKPHISVNCVLSGQTNQDVQDFLKEWHQVGRVIVPYQESASRDYSTAFWQECPTYQMKYCDAPFYYMAILWDGRVVPCCNDVHAQNILGDLKEQTIMEVWNDQKYKSLRKKPCVECDLWRKRFITQREGDIMWLGICKNYLQEREA